MKTKIINLGVACSCVGLIYVLMWSLSCLSVAAVLNWEGDSLGGAAAKLYVRQAIGFLFVGAIFALVLLCGSKVINSIDRIEVKSVVAALLRVAAVLLASDGFRFYVASDGGNIVFLVPSMLGVVLYISSFRDEPSESVEKEVNPTGQP